MANQHIVIGNLKGAIADAVVNQAILAAELGEAQAGLARALDRIATLTQALEAAGVYVPEDSGEQAASEGPGDA